MASSAATRPQIGSPQIFNSDPLESVFAKQMVSDPIMGGIAGANFLVAQNQRDRDQATYLDNLRQANMLQIALSRQQDAADLTKEAFGKLPDLIGHGQNPADIPIVSQFYRPGANQDQASQTIRALAIARAAEANAHAAASGAAANEKAEVVVVYDANGQPTYQIKVKGPSAQHGVDTAQSVKPSLAFTPQIPPPGSGPRPGTPVPQASPTAQRLLNTGTIAHSIVGP